MHDYEFEENQKVVVVLGGIEVDEEIINQVYVIFSSAIKEIKEVFSNMAVALTNVFNIVKEILAEEIDREEKRELYKLNFTRPMIQHQVLCRKPKLIRKIIR